MKILILTLVRISTLKERGNYQDFFRKIKNEGNEIFVVSPVERRYNCSTSLSEEKNAKFLQVWIPNFQKTDLIEKTISLMVIEFLYKKAINKYFNNYSFDLILYSTPPITLTSLISELKFRYNAKTYLLLKDIFPQNAVDLKLISKNGFIYKYFRRKEKKLYNISDWIGCMSPANEKYLINQNPWLSSSKIVVNPNSIEIFSRFYHKAKMKKYLDVKEEKIIFLYGGNLGKPQGIDFLLEAIKECQDIQNAFFLIIGSGTEEKKVLNWFKINNPKNSKHISFLPKNEYDSIVGLCHVGLIFLNKNFTIPNYPSRILSYMENKLPILCATDSITDIGTNAQKNKYGFYCKNGDIKKFKFYVKLLTYDNKLRNKLGKNSFKYLKSNFTTDISYEILIKHFK